MTVDQLDVVDGIDGAPEQNGNGAGHSVIVPTLIIKRDGRVMPFDVQRIEHAMARCFASFGRTPTTPVEELAQRVLNIVAAKAGERSPTVEEVQDIVETVLQAAGEFEAAKRYILYRAERAREREKRPVPDHVRIAFDDSRQYFPTPIQQFQFFDKYSRFNYDLGRRETWIETVDRAVDYMYDLAGSRLPRETYERVRRGILEMRAMPSMRLLAMAGPAARRNSVAIYNCSYQPVESIDSFVEALIISMAGCGVGFSVESRYVENFPRIRRQTGRAATNYVVEDSAEGWADALRFGLETWFDGGDVHFDLSQLRSAGAPLITKGGRASGPEPFRAMLDFVRTRILARQGSFLRPIDAHDMMCAVGNAAVSGGVRRTAMISLFDYDDDEMRLAKSGDFERENSQRWNANNSAVWPKGGFMQQEFIHQFMEMVESGRGEPGIFNREAANVMKPARRKEAEFGTNPSLRKGTLVYTSEGIVPIESLEGKRFLVRNLNGDLSPATCFLSGENKPLIKLQLKGGHTYYATPEHKWPVVNPDGTITKLTTPELKPGMHLPIVRPETLGFGVKGDYDDGFLAGWMSGDGWILTRGDTNDTQYGLIVSNEDYQQGIATRIEQTLQRLGCSATFSRRERDGSVWYELNTTSGKLNRWAVDLGIHPKADGLPSSIWKEASEDFRKGFIDGLFSSDGSIDLSKQPGYSVAVLVSAHKKLIDDVSTLLGFYGIKTSVRESYNVSRFPNARDYEREYVRYDLSISGLNDIAHFRSLFHLSHTAKQTKLDSGKPREKSHFGTDSVKIVAVEATDLREDVWDISVFDDTHCFQLAHCITGNCGEINLRPWQFCNLTAAVARVDDTLESLRDKVEIATIIGSIQSMATHFPGLRPMWKENCEEERLLGVDITGQMDSPVAQDAQVKRQLREIATDTNREVAAALGINASASITCVKPSGNSSQLLNCSSGLHARWAPYYIRNVRVATHAPLFKVLHDAGVPMDPENGQTRENANTWVIHFPMKSPEGAVTRNQRTAVEQCEYWLQNKLYWTDHNPSCTITYKPDEVLDLMKWVWEHRDQIGGLSFLPSFDAQYAQMPYIEITREEYEHLAADFPEVDFSKVWRYEEEDLTTAAQELACVGGYCEVEIVPQDK
ncbi:MAG TPA: ATP cone domain-containing protein [Roseiflexaceae bacterium]|nr:ATP cone domain-containing protein [Roseiflexaceae bacterium]